MLKLLTTHKILSQMWEVENSNIKSFLNEMSNNNYTCESVTDYLKDNKYITLVKTEKTIENER